MSDSKLLLCSGKQAQMRSWGVNPVMGLVALKGGEKPGTATLLCHAGSGQETLSRHQLLAAGLASSQDCEEQVSALYK